MSEGGEMMIAETELRIGVIFGDIWSLGIIRLSLAYDRGDSFFCCMPPLFGLASLW